MDNSERDTDDDGTGVYHGELTGSLWEVVNPSHELIAEVAMAIDERLVYYVSPEVDLGTNVGTCDGFRHYILVRDVACLDKLFGGFQLLPVIIPAGRSLYLAPPGVLRLHALVKGGEHRCDHHGSAQVGLYRLYELSTHDATAG